MRPGFLQPQHNPAIDHNSTLELLNGGKPSKLNFKESTLSAGGVTDFSR
jgi:hypothetical protein